MRTWLAGHGNCPYSGAMSTTPITFPNAHGTRLAGRLDRPEDTPRGWALFAHCFTCSKDSRAAVFIARALVEAGFGVLRFDFTGLGESAGDFADTHFSSNVDDLVAAADWLRAHHGAPALVIGHSLGGAAILAAGARIPDAKAFATIGAPFEPEHVTHNFGTQVQTIETEGRATVQLGGRDFTIDRAFLDDVRGQRQAERIRALRRPLMVLHSPIDKTVDISNASGIFQAAMHPKSFVSLDDADHLLSRQEDARYAASVIAAWAARYLPAAAQPQSENAAVTDGLVHVAERGTGAYTVAIAAGPHHWLGDEPAGVGGDDLGPSPYQMLSAALGACTAMTVRMYANRKQWPLAHVKVALRHAKIHAQDCAECETKAGQIDRIERFITLEGDLDAAQRQRLLEIADMCPVLRTWHSEVQVVTQEADAGLPQ